MIVDTDVLIWYMRGSEKSRKAISKLDHFFISVVTYMELVQRMRSKRELKLLRKAMHAWNAKVLYISEEISAKAMFEVERHFLSHSMQLADALIGTTAMAYGLTLLTGNDRHYKVMKDLQTKKFRP